MRPVDSDDYRDRQESGMTRRQEVRLAGRMVKAEKRRRWETRPEGRQATVDLLEETVEDVGVPLVLRLMAAKVYMGVEAQNQADDRMDAVSGGNEEHEPQVILVLPSNGSEVKAESVSAEDDGDSEGEVEDD